MVGKRGRVRPIRKTSGLDSSTVLFLCSGKFVHRDDRARSDRDISRSFVAARVVLDSHRAARRRSLLPHCWSLGLFLCRLCASLRACVYACALCAWIRYLCAYARSRARLRMGASRCSIDARARTYIGCLKRTCLRGESSFLFFFESFCSRSIRGWNNHRIH